MSVYEKPASGSDGLGVGQTWQDMTASRALNVTYINNSNRAIAVSITQSQVSSSGYIIIDGVTISTQQTTESAYLSWNGFKNNMFAIVPKGSNYKVSGSSVIKWSELR